MSSSILGGVFAPDHLVYDIYCGIIKTSLLLLESTKTSASKTIPGLEFIVRI